MKGGVSIKITKSQLVKYIDNYQESDDILISLFLETYDYYSRLRDELKKSKLTYDYTNKAGATNRIKNPLIIELTKTVQTLNNILKSMGLTAAQRKKITEEDMEDGFGDY